MSLASFLYGSWVSDEAARVGIGRVGIHNGQYDAFRHALTSASVTKNLGESVAKYTGDYHESTHLNSFAESYMDSYNNAYGRLIGQKHVLAGDIAEATAEAIREGDLIISLDDPRIPTGYGKNKTVTPSEAQHISDIASIDVDLHSFFSEIDDISADAQSRTRDPEEATGPGDKPASPEAETTSGNGDVRGPDPNPSCRGPNSIGGAL